MKIKRRKKNDRTAFWFMPWVRYWHYRLSINSERRLDKTLPPETKQKRDRARAAWMTKQFKEGTPVGNQGRFEAFDARLEHAAIYGFGHT